MSDESGGSEFSDVESALRTLTPAAMSRPETAIAYRAGLRAGRRERNRWRGVAAMAVLTVSIMLLRHQTDRSPANAAFTETMQTVAPPPAKPARVQEDNYAVMTAKVIQGGWEAIPMRGGMGGLDRNGQSVVMAAGG